MLENHDVLKVLASREEGGAQPATRPDERARADRVGAPETDREALERRVRAFVAAADSEAEFVQSVRTAGISIRARWAKGGTQAVTGYSVQLRSQPNLRTGRTEKAIAFSGLQLAKDLSLPAMRDWAGWDTSEQAKADALDAWSRPRASRTSFNSPFGETVQLTLPCKQDR